MADVALMAGLRWYYRLSLPQINPTFAPLHRMETPIVREKRDMKSAKRGIRVRKQRKSPLRARSELHNSGTPIERVALPEVEVFTDSVDSPEVQEATHELRHVHDAQVADDDFQ